MSFHSDHKAESIDRMSSGTTHGVTLTPGTLFMTNSAAVVALGCPTSFSRKRNCLLRLLTSIVSMSMT